MQCMLGPMTALASVRNRAIGKACTKSLITRLRADCWDSRMRTLLFCLAVVLAGCMGRSDDATSDWFIPYEADQTGIRYESAGGYQHFFSFESMVLYASFTAEQLRERIQGDGEVSLGRSWRMWDCSDAGFSCLRTRQFVFAVPRHGLSRETSYQAEGQRFDVIGCRDDACRVAEIRATCERSEGGACVAANGAAEGAYAMTYFTFDSAIGVTAIEFGPDARGQPEQMSMLVGERGILAPLR